MVRKALAPVMVAKRPLNAEAKTFLVPVDFCSCARKAAGEALMLAESLAAALFSSMSSICILFMATLMEMT